MSKFSTGICLILLMFFNGSQCVAWETVYTTPGSYLQLKMNDLEESIHCDFIPKGQEIKKRIVNASRDYNTNIYQLITSKMATVSVHAPQEIGRFPIRLQIFELDRKKVHLTGKLFASENETYGTEGSPIDITFTLNSTQTLLNRPLRSNEDAVTYLFQFNLRIKNASIEDDGIYKCLVVTPWIDIVVAPIRFLYQTDDNIVYGQEAKAMNISCAAVSGHKQEKISIKHNGSTLSTSESHTVTFTFIPDRHDNSKEYECVGRHVFSLIRVKLLVNYAPDVQVIARKHSLDCFATGFPQTYTFEKWEHQSEQGEHIRFVDGLPNGTLKLEMLKQKYQTNGRYICRVSNGIPDVNGSLFQRGSTSLQYTGHPVFASENGNVKDVQLYKPITLTFLIYSDPIVDGISMRGVAADFEKNETIHDFRLSGTDLMYTEFGQNGKIKGFKISFDLKMLSSNYEVYNIWACNGRGADYFSFKIQAIGEPIFAPENRNVKHGKIDQPLTLTFVLYSNPIMKDIWIESASTGNNHAITQDDFKISNRMLPYTVFGNKGNISGYEIIFETKILRSNDFHEYYMWAKNELGVDFYRFEIILLGTSQSKAKDTTRFITSSCIAAGLFIYIIIVRICFSVKQRVLTGMQRTSTPAELHYHTYDEIGSMSNEAATFRFSLSDQQESSQQTRVGQSSQIAISEIDIHNHMLLNDRHSISPNVFPHEYQANTTPQNEEAIDMPSPLSIGDIMFRYRSCIEEGYNSSDESSHSLQIRRNQSERSSVTNGTSECSKDSEESNIDSLNTTSVDINIEDAYESPYQMIKQEIQDTHQYSSIIHPVEIIDTTDYVNLRL